MTIAQKYQKENPNTYDSWLRMHLSVMRLVEKKGDEAIVWKNMSVKNCKHWQQFAEEEEFFEVVIVYRDGIHKCFDYNENNIV